MVFLWTRPPPVPPLVALQGFPVCNHGLICEWLLGNAHTLHVNYPKPLIYVSYLSHPVTLMHHKPKLIPDYSCHVYSCYMAVSLYLMPHPAHGKATRCPLALSATLGHENSDWHLGGQILFFLVSCCVCIHHILCSVLRCSITLLLTVLLSVTLRDQCLLFKHINFCYSCIIYLTTHSCTLGRHYYH